MKRESRNILGSLSWEDRQTEMSIFSALNFNSGIVNKTNKYISLTRPSSILTQSVPPSETQEVLYIYIHIVSVYKSHVQTLLQYIRCRRNRNNNFTNK